jgi:MFS family permease
MDCRGQPLLDKLYNLHHGHMDSLRATRDETILAESTQLVPRKFVITAALVVLVHTVVMLVHGVAHMRLNVALSPWASIYVLGIAGIGPIAGLLLLRSSRKRTGATILLTTMIGALLFGLWKHFIAHGADHVMHLQAGPWRLPFQATAALLAVSEAAGAVIAFVLLRALTPHTKARARERNY